MSNQNIKCDFFLPVKTLLALNVMSGAPSVRKGNVLLDIKNGQRLNAMQNLKIVGAFVSFISMAPPIE